MRFKEFLSLLEIHGTNLAISSVDDEGDGGDQQMKTLLKPGALQTYNLQKTKKKSKAKYRKLFNFD